MCLRKLRDILFPTNLLGKDVKSVSFDTSGIPLVDMTKTLQVEWQGEINEMTFVIYRPIAGGKRRFPQRYVLTNGESQTIVLSNYLKNRIDNEVLYFKCTNVTSLSVNGQQII